MQSFDIHLSSEAKTTALASKIAPLLEAGDVVLLEGALGAGKTTLARGLIRAYSGAAEIPSPTYALVEIYEGAKGALWHFDLYRLDSPGDVWELGLEEALSEGICVIEWAERVAALLPDDALRLVITIAGKNKRELKIFAPENWVNRLNRAGIV